MRDYFRSRSTMQLPSTVDNFRQHLLHHDTSFIAFSMNERKTDRVYLPSIDELVNNLGGGVHRELIRSAVSPFLAFTWGRIALNTSSKWNVLHIKSITL